MAEFVKQCHKDKMDLEDTEKAYQTCTDKGSVTHSFWQTTEGLAVLSFVSLGLGVLVGVGL